MRELQKDCTFTPNITATQTYSNPTSTRVPTAVIVNLEENESSKLSNKPRSPREYYNDQMSFQ
jgi:hypothetical protein